MKSDKPLLERRKIAIIAGGDSSEYEVSLRSAKGIYSFLDHDRYDVTVVRLHGNDWTALPDADIEHEDLTGPGYSIDKNDFSFTRAGAKHTFDFAYITIHGTPGENGVLQGYLDMIGLPYSCCGVLAAALTFNKYACNHYLSYFGFHIANSMILRAGQKWPNAPKIAETLGLPCFIKSNVGGSSFGCTKVKTVEDIYPAIERAFKEGDEVICEAFMQGTEVTCGVYKTKDKAVAFPITEVVTHNEFFDYDAKYKGQVDEITPARIPDALRDKIQAETLRLYDIIGANGIIRVDWIITGDKINLLEVNTTPGMTATSFIPQQIRAAGLDIKDVLTDIIENKFV
ncbi:MAG: D-alanine--D-alanine ligase [Paludibacteraceae bacterium]|nr:D-alanine--D-alanine ligase [Paludibacteraceae bacterium]